MFISSWYHGIISHFPGVKYVKQMVNRRCKNVKLSSTQTDVLDGQMLRLRWRVDYVLDGSVGIADIMC